MSVSVHFTTTTTCKNKEKNKQKKNLTSFNHFGIPFCFAWAPVDKDAEDWGGLAGGGNSADVAFFSGLEFLRWLKRKNNTKKTWVIETEI